LPPGIDPVKPGTEVAFTMTIGFEVRARGASLLRFKVEALTPPGDALAVGRLATTG